MASLAIAGATAAVLTTVPAIAADISGAGATFPYPIYAKWADAYKKETNIGLNYQSIGSGGGIKQIQNKTVTFGATDAPLKGAQLDKDGLVQFPMVMGGIVPVLNLDGIKAGDLVIDGPTLAKIFLGEIKSWDDPALKKLNKGKSLPDLAITVIHRSDNSGTTYNLTEYLNSVSTQWKSGVGKGVAVNWPVGVGARGSSGVAATLSQTNGGITYVDVAYSLKSHFKIAAVKNRAGVFQLPGLRAIAAAGATILRVAPNNSGISIVNPSKRQPLAYPICTFTYVIIPTNTPKAKELKQLVRWAVTKGQASGPKLLFSPLPKVVLKASIKTLNSVHS
jgi:phosphate transport system substrate-binding protein